MRILNNPYKFNQAISACQYREHLQLVNQRVDLSLKNPLTTDIWHFPKGLHPKDLKVVGYGQGDKIDKPKGITWNCFDRIMWFGFSGNPIDGKQFIHSRADKGEKTYLLIFEKK